MKKTVKEEKKDSDYGDRYCVSMIVFSVSPFVVHSALPSPFLLLHHNDSLYPRTRCTISSCLYSSVSTASLHIFALVFLWLVPTSLVSSRAQAHYDKMKKKKKAALKT